MRHSGAVILALWAFVGGPALCVAGLWVRECPMPCSCCEEGCSPCTHHGCEDDPCQVNVVQVQKSRADDFRPVATCPFAAGAVAAHHSTQTLIVPGCVTIADVDISPGVIALSARIAPLLI